MKENYETIIEEKFEYNIKNNKNYCDLTIFKSKHNCKAVVIISDRNEGISITNSIEYIIAQVNKKYRLKKRYTFYFEDYPNQYSIIEAKNNHKDYSFVSLNKKGKPTWKKTDKSLLMLLTLCLNPKFKNIQNIHKFIISIINDDDFVYLGSERCIELSDNNEVYPEIFAKDRLGNITVLIENSIKQYLKSEFKIRQVR